MASSADVAPRVRRLLSSCLDSVQLAGIARACSAHGFITKQGDPDQFMTQSSTGV